MKSACDTSTVITPSSVQCGDGGKKNEKHLHLTRAELAIITEHSAIYGHGWIFRGGELLQIKL